METKVEKEWTFDQPTKEGYYWIEVGLGDFDIAKIEKDSFGEILAKFTNYAHPTNIKHLKGNGWYGPFTHPPIKLLKEENDEKSNS